MVSPSHRCSCTNPPLPQDYRDWMNERGDILVARPQRALGTLPAGAAGAKSALVVAPATAAAMPGGAWPAELQVGAWSGGHRLGWAVDLMWERQSRWALAHTSGNLAPLQPVVLVSCFTPIQELFMRHAVLPKAEGARPSERSCLGAAGWGGGWGQGLRETPPLAQTQQCKLGCTDIISLTLCPNRSSGSRCRRQGQEGRQRRGGGGCAGGAGGAGQPCHRVQLVAGRAAHVHSRSLQAMACAVAARCSAPALQRVTYSRKLYIHAIEGPASSSLAGALPGRAGGSWPRHAAGGRRAGLCGRGGRLRRRLHGRRVSRGRVAGGLGGQSWALWGRPDLCRRLPDGWGLPGLWHTFVSFPSRDPLSLLASASLCQVPGCGHGRLWRLCGGGGAGWG